MLNVEYENTDRESNDTDYTPPNKMRMNQLEFLRPHLFNPPHQISTMTSEASTSDGMSESEKLIVPKLGEDEYKESDDEEEVFEVQGDQAGAVEEMIDDESNDTADYHQISGVIMDQLSFLHSHVLNPTHQISRISEQASTADDKDSVSMSGKLVLPRLPTMQKDEEDMKLEKYSDFEQDQKSKGQGFQEGAAESLQLQRSERSDFYLQQLQILFEEVELEKQAECYLAVTKALNHVHGKMA